MKYIVNILRVLVGLLFIFSGGIKSNDPTGFSYKLDEYFSVFAADLEAEQDQVLFSVVTDEGEAEHVVDVNPNAQDIEIVANNSTWQVQEIALSDTFKASQASITIDGTRAYEAPLVANNNDSVVLDAVISWSVNGKSLGSKTISFRKDDIIAQSISVPTQQFVKPNSWIVDFLQGMRKYALHLAIFLCVLEIILGLALLICWAPKFTITSLILIIVFFTFLTWYSATYNKVTDCGCFGDAIKLTPWESFYKDVILSVSIAIIALGIRHIKPIFSKPFAVRLLTIATLLSVGFSLYCWHYLPVKNFLKFRKGNNIKELAVVPDDAPTDVYENVFIYAKDGVEEEFTLEQMSGRDLKAEGYEFVDRRDKLISKGYEPEIHDFKIMDETRTNDYVEDFFGNDSTHKILIVMNDVTKSNTNSIQELKDIIAYSRENDIQIYPLTASSNEVVEAFRHEHQLDIPFYYGDKTNLKSIIRSNPGLVLMDGNEVKKNWPSTRLPSVKSFKRKVEK